MLIRCKYSQFPQYLTTNKIYNSLSMLMDEKGNITHYEIVDDTGHNSTWLSHNFDAYVKKTKSECGRLGGLVILEKYGREYLRELGRKGAVALHKKYNLVPNGTSDFVLVDRQTNKIISKTIRGISL